MLDNLANFLSSDLRGAFLGATAGVVLSVAIKLATDVRHQRRTNKAIANRDIGIQFANLVYTTHQWREGKDKKYTQRLRGITAKLDLAKVFNGKAQERYLEYLNRATELACKSETNPYVPDYIEQAIKDCHSGLWRSAINVFAKIDAKEIRKNMLRDLKIGVAEYIQDRVNSYPRLFDGVDFDSVSGTTLYPMLVGEKESEHQQVKIIMVRKHDLNEGVIADKAEDVYVRTGPGKYEREPDHRDMLRWRTNTKLIKRLSEDDACRKEMGIQIGLPIILQLATQAQRQSAGIIPPLP